VTLDGTKDDTEWLVPLPAPERLRLATHFRSTWLTASQAALRERGFGARYESLLDPRDKDQILTCVPGKWLPMEVARSHYLACERLDLPLDDLLAIGRDATRRANATSFAFIARIAQGSGVTPWTVLSHASRLWSVTCQGGALGVARVGPKDARLHIAGFPLAAIRYNRVTMRGIALGSVELFCRKAIAHEIAPMGDATTVVIRLSWV
jgi:hypothetical protein